MIVSRRLAVLVFIVAVIACGDPAEKPFRSGMAAEEAGLLAKAQSDYSKAVDAAPGSEYGRQAKARLDSVKYKLKLEAERKARERARQKSEAEAERRRQEESCKSGRYTFFCEGGGGLLTEPSKAKCERSRQGFVEGFKVRCAPCRCADGVPGAH